MDNLRLLDFEIEISPAGLDGRYPTAVLHSPSGQARAALDSPWAAADLSAQLAELEDAVLGGGPAASQRVQAFGGQLFDALMAGQVRTVFDRSRQAVADQGEGLRIKLRVNAPDLAVLPWEFLYDPRAGEFLALSRLTPIVRYLELPLGEQALAVKPPLRILAMVAGPADAPPLDVAREKARLEQAVQPLQAKGQVELVWLEGESWRSLQAALQAGPWHVFHFVGHAAFDPSSGEGMLLLAGDDGLSAPVSASQLAGLLADHRTLRLAVLNACEGARGSEQSRFSSIAAGLVRRGLPAVLAMQYAISDRAAIEFTASFFTALAAGLPIDAATSEARKAIDLAGSLEWGTPLLIMRTPDGVLWEVQPRRRLPLMAAAGLGAAAIAVLALLLWLAAGQSRIARIVSQPTPTPLATPTPARMSGTFNIAVASFGQLDPTTGQVRESEEGRLLSQWLAENLVDELRRTGDEDLPGRVEVWHDAVESPNKNVQLGTLLGNSAVERQAAAAQLADAIRATMVIYGNVVGSGDSSELDIQFYLPRLLSASEFGDLLDAQRMGRPVAGPFDSGDALSATEAEGQMGWRGRALFWLTQGLIQHLLGKSEQALAIFNRAEQALAGWPEREGKEILYFFQGREHFFLAGERQRADEARSLALDEAQRLFARAIALKPDYARARAALGSVQRRRAELIADPATRLADANLAAAIREQEQAVQDAKAAGDPLLEAIVNAALAKSYSLLGRTHYELGQHGEASPWLDRAVALADSAGAVLADNGVVRVLAQTYETQGVVRLTQYDILRSAGDLAGARARVDQAQAAFESCIAQGENARRDEILLEQVIGAAPDSQDDNEDEDEVLQGCQRLLELTQQIAQELGDSEP